MRDPSMYEPLLGDPSGHDLSRRARGAWGEGRAAGHLRALGFTVVDRNWRPPERELRGDLDVVARRGDLIVFCEVKARRRPLHGGAAAAVDGLKQQRVRDLAASWLRQRGLAGADDLELRFDVIAIDGVTLTHHRGAF
ncbi:MAG TPA: YraN family protein [Ilumatobacter sp.]